MLFKIGRINIGIWRRVQREVSQYLNGVVSPEDLPQGELLQAPDEVEAVLEGTAVDRGHFSGRALLEFVHGKGRNGRTAHREDARDKSWEENQSPLSRKSSIAETCSRNEVYVHLVEVMIKRQKKI